MQRGYNNYDFVVDSSFQPFSLQEMMVPFLQYKDAYEKTEEAYMDLSDKSDKFKYLSETLPKDSKARQVYEGYANELSRQAEDLAKNGLSMGNRRALTNLKRRYQGEIGRLDLADQALQEEKKLRRQLSAKDSSMLYAMDNLSIDNFLDGNTPNLYNISGTELYTRGAAAGKAASSRVYSAGDAGSTLGGYYRKWVEKNGYSKESMDAFRANISAIPELQQAADAILAERGVNENLTGANLERARQSVINGIIDGAVYSEKVNPVRDPGVMSAAEKDSSARGWASHNLQKENRDFERAISGYEKDENGQWKYNPDKDQTVKKAEAIAKAKVPVDENGKPITKSGRGSGRTAARKAKTSKSFDANGNAYDITTKEGTNRGKLVSYAEAITKYPAVSQYISQEDADLYDFFDNGSRVYVIGHPDQTNNSESSTQTSNDDNQI